MNQVQNGYTGWQFIDSGVIYMSGNTVENGTGVIFCPNAGKPICPFVYHSRHMSQSFHIVDGGRAPPQTFLCREGRFNTGIAALAFNGLEHRGLFTADIGTSSCNYIEVAAEVRSEERRVGNGGRDRRGW